MITLIFIVNGEEVPLVVPRWCSLEVTLQEALAISRNESRPIAEWELRHESGALVDRTMRAGAFTDHTLVFVTLRTAAGGGAWQPSAWRSIARTFMYREIVNEIVNRRLQ